MFPRCSAILTSSNILSLLWNSWSAKSTTWRANNSTKYTFYNKYLSYNNIDLWWFVLFLMLHFSDIFWGRSQFRDTEEGYLMSPLSWLESESISNKRGPILPVKYEIKLNTRFPTRSYLSINNIHFLNDLPTKYKEHYTPRNKKMPWSKISDPSII